MPNSKNTHNPLLIDQTEENHVILNGQGSHEVRCGWILSRYGISMRECFEAINCLQNPIDHSRSVLRRVLRDVIENRLQLRGDALGQQNSKFGRHLSPDAVPSS